MTLTTVAKNSIGIGVRLGNAGGDDIDLVVNENVLVYSTDSSYGIWLNANDHDVTVHGTVGAT